MRPYISKKLCENCKECIDICPYEVFACKEGDVIVHAPEDCIECTSCVEMCPNKAIYMDD
ncbi:MAG: ferredoxin [Syntrophus sp. (in: bacteria)]|nr:ferredoxin [Syntrophus sp. (in: bacteria)]